jgi:hypothetical protein
MSIAYVFTVGVWLAVLQVVLFMSLEMLLSSAFLTYLVVVGAWLIGAVAGVWIPRGRWSAALPVAAGVAPYGVYALLLRYPFATPLIWAHGGLIALTALFAGQFFQQERTTFRRIGTLFFWENTGFIVGLIVGLVGVVLGGRTFIGAAPGIGLVVVMAMAGVRGSRGGR